MQSERVFISRLPQYLGLFRNFTSHAASRLDFSPLLSARYSWSRFLPLVIMDFLQVSTVGKKQDDRRLMTVLVLYLSFRVVHLPSFYLSFPLSGGRFSKVVWVVLLIRSGTSYLTNHRTSIYFGAWTRFTNIIPYERVPLPFPSRERERRERATRSQRLIKFKISKFEENLRWLASKLDRWKE